jgi:hypothetical protein
VVPAPQILEEHADLAFHTPLHTRRTPCFVAAGASLSITGRPLNSFKNPAGPQQLLVTPSSQASDRKMSRAERGDLEVLRLVHEAAQRAPPAAKLCLDQPGPRMRTSLMAACQLG